MPIQLPNIDNRTYDDLMKEMIASIPKYAKEWTNFNPSDPGITILELLVWIGEALIYRTNIVPEESYLNFLKLVAGDTVYDETDIAHQRILEYLKGIAQGKVKKDIQAMKAEAQKFLNSRYRAVTEDDFRELAIMADSRIKRAKVTVTVNRVEIVIILENETLVKIEKFPDGIRFPDSLKDKIRYSPKKKSLIFRGIMSGGEKDQLQSLSTDSLYKEAIEELFNKSQDKNVQIDLLIKNVEAYFKPRKLIGTVINVKMAEYTDVSLKIMLVCESYAKPETVRVLIRDAITTYLDSTVGGQEGHGWPYGRNLMVYELFNIVENVEGVKYVNKITTETGDGFTEIEIKGLINLKNLEVVIEEEK